MMQYSDRPNAYINAKDLEIAIVKATSYGDALDAVREAPSIKIVRCQMCKYNPDKPRNYYDDDMIDTFAWCYTFVWSLNGEGYCPYGKEIEDNE